MLEQFGNRLGMQGPEAGGLWGVGAGRVSCFLSACSPVMTVLQDSTPRVATARSISPWSPQHRQTHLGPWYWVSCVCALGTGGCPGPGCWVCDLQRR